MRFNIPEELFVGYEPEPSAEPEPAAPPAPDPEVEFADAGRRYGQLVSSLAQAGSRLGTLEDSFGDDPDHLTMPNRFREGADSLRDEYASRFDHGPTRDIFLRDFGRLAAPKRDRIEKGAFGRALQERLGGLRTEALRAGDDEEAQNHALRQAASEFRRAQHFGHVADAGTAMRAFLDDIAEARRAVASPVPVAASPDGVMPSEAGAGELTGGSPFAMGPGSANDMAEATQDATAPDNSDSAADMAGHLLPPGRLPEAQDAFDRSGRNPLQPAESIVNDLVDRTNSPFDQSTSSRQNFIYRYNDHPGEVTAQVAPYRPNEEGRLIDARPPMTGSNILLSPNVGRDEQLALRMSGAGRQDDRDPGHNVRRSPLPARYVHEFAVPPSKLEFLEGRTYDQFLAELRLLPSQPDATVRRAFANTYAFEGGMVPNQNGAVAGITVGTLADYKRFYANELRQHPEDSQVQQTHAILNALPNDPRQLSPAQVAQFYEIYANHALRTVSRNDANHRSGTELLSSIEDPKTAGMFFDTLIRHGTGKGSKAIQQAVNVTLDELRQQGVELSGLPATIPEDGRMGPDTFNTYLILANNGHADSLRKNLMRRRNNVESSADDKARTQYYAEPD